MAYKIVASVGGQIAGQQIAEIKSYAMDRRGNYYILAFLASHQFAMFRNDVPVSIPPGIGIVSSFQVNNAGDVLLNASITAPSDPHPTDTSGTILFLNGKAIAQPGQMFDGFRLTRIYNAVLADDGTVAFTADRDISALLKQPYPIGRTPNPTAMFDTKGNAFTLGSVIGPCTISTIDTQQLLMISRSGITLFHATALCSDTPNIINPATRLFLTSKKRLPDSGGQALILPDGRVVDGATVGGITNPRITQERQPNQIGVFGDHAAYTTKHDGIVDENFNPIIQQDFTFGQFSLHDLGGAVRQVPEMAVHVTPAMVRPGVFMPGIFGPPPDIRETNAGLIFYAEGIRYYRRGGQDAVDSMFSGIFTKDGPVLYSRQPSLTEGDFRIVDSFAVDDGGQVLTGLFYFIRGMSGALNHVVLVTPLVTPLKTLKQVPIKSNEDPCQTAISQLDSVQTLDGDPTTGFLRNQKCISVASCNSDLITDKTWLKRVVLDFVTPFTSQSGEWKQIEDACRARNVPSFVKTILCEQDMATYHINQDLQTALDENGCGSQSDWDAIGVMLQKCVIKGVYEDVGLHPLPMAYASAEVVEMRDEVRRRCIQYRKSKGLPLQ